MKLKSLVLPLAFSLLATAAQPIKSLVQTAVSFTPVPQLKTTRWSPFDLGFKETKEGLMLDNGTDPNARRGVGKELNLNQITPMPIVVSAESKAVDVAEAGSGSYSLYLDVTYEDGTHQWGVKSAFTPGTHDWEKREIFFQPPKPIRQVNCWMLLRRPGKAFFRNLEVTSAPPIKDAQSFDTLQVLNKRPYTGWLLRDVKAQSDYISYEQQDKSVLGITLDQKRETRSQATLITATLRATDLKQDRILNLTYVITLPKDSWKWLPCSRDLPQEANSGSFTYVQHYNVGANGFCATLPFAAVATDTKGTALGMDLLSPAYGRVFYNAAQRELAVTWDIALTPEVPTATVKLIRFDFQPTWGLRSAFAKLYRIYPEQFKVRIKKQGLWMAFAPISKIQNFQDFGFAIKEGNGETQWDDQHDIATFRYTEPMTWWMHLPRGQKRSLQNSLDAVRQQQKNPKFPRAKAFDASIMHDEYGRPYGQHLDTPWCNGTVWSMNSMPGIKGTYTDFNLKWNPQIFQELYGPKAKGVLEGEYVDSSEGYVTHVIDCNRQHFAAAQTPLTFSTANLKPGIFRGLIAYEYVKALADDLHPIGKMTMANSTPSALWFLAPHLDVMGTETNWNRNNQWSPMEDKHLLYIRFLCHQKPFCFLQNTDFTCFTPEKVEKFMRRSLFYGMFPSFFSANASSGHYFRTPELYNRDRQLFKKYVPLCKLVAEAGWQPETLARSDHRNIWIERFGDHLYTVFNGGDTTQQATLTFDRTFTKATNILGNGQAQTERTIRILLNPEDVAVISVRH